MGINSVPGGQVEEKLTPEKISTVLAVISRRLDFMRRKIERYHPDGQPMSLVEPGEQELSQEELSKLWNVMKEFDPAMHRMDDVLT